MRSLSRSRLTLAAAVAVLGLAPVARAQEPDTPVPEPKVLNVHPAAEPVPSLKYRLFPMESERNPGDAAPVYLRLAWEMRDEAGEQVRTKADDWLARPIDAFPVDEAREFVDGWSTRLRQLHFAARRQSCDWAYTIPEQREESISILLPDAQGLRIWFRLLPVKARLEIVEGRYDDAVETIQTGMGFARHVGEGPFLINGLVGTAMANETLDRVEELIARPDAPNLYWALTVLPEPMIDYRGAVANEQKVVEWMFPELTDLDAPRTPAEWDARLARLFERLGRVTSQFIDYGIDYKPTLKGLDLDAFRARLLPEAKTYLKAHRDAIEGLDDAQTIVRYAAARVAELRDVTYRPTYLPYAQARAFYESDSYQKATKALEGTPLAILGGLQVSNRQGHASQTVMQRRIEALRAVEALRMYAASHDGTLPETLDAVEAVPVPADPSTGRPFTYRRDGDAAVLSSPPVSDAQPGLAYRITVAK